MAFSAVGAVVDAVVGGTAVAGGVATVAAAVGEVGMAMSVVGAVTGNSTLTKVGGAMGLAGGITSLASGAFGTATANIAGGALGDLPPAPDPNAVMGPVSSANSTADTLGMNSTDGVDTMDGGAVTTPVPTPPPAQETPLAPLDSTGGAPADANASTSGTSPSSSQNPSITAPSTNNSLGNVSASNPQGVISSAMPPAGTVAQAMQNATAPATSGAADTLSSLSGNADYNSIANAPGSQLYTPQITDVPASTSTAPIGAEMNGAAVPATSTSAASPANITSAQTTSLGSAGQLAGVTPNSSLSQLPGVSNLDLQNAGSDGVTTPVNRPSSNFFSGVSNAQLAMGALSGVGQAYSAQKNYELGEGQLALAQQKQANINSQPAAGTVGIIANARKNANSGS